METTQLFYRPKNGYDRYDAARESAMNAYCAEYKAFLNTARTERLCVKEAVQIAEAAGFSAWESGRAYKTGDRVYCNNRGKSLYLAVIGKRPLSEGMNIAGAHVDSPRLDLKHDALLEKAEFAYFNTHHYGSPRMYQWAVAPLALYGVVIRKDGTTAEVSIGGEEDEPVFMFADLLMHLAKDLDKKPAEEMITTSMMKILMGSRPLPEGEASERVKGLALKLLWEKYGITEEDFLSAELELVPAGRARDLGLDGSMIVSYGHDDRSSAYACLKAVTELGTPEKTAVAILTDKEETGSDGNTGLQARAFDRFADSLCRAQGVSLCDSYAASLALSADVTAGYDPNFDANFEKASAAKLNYGTAVQKDSGHRGKSGTSDASAETVGKVRRILDGAGVIWQMCEFGGKPEKGGGGTIAKYLANRNIDVIDYGVPLLSMHAPWEVAAKLDLYEHYLGIRALFENRE